MVKMVIVLHIPRLASMTNVCAEFRALCFCAQPRVSSSVVQARQVVENTSSQYKSTIKYLGGLLKYRVGSVVSTVQSAQGFMLLMKLSGLA